MTAAAVCLPKVKKIIQGKRFELVQFIKAITSAQLKSQKNSGIALERGKSGGLSVIEAWKNILKRIDGNMYFNCK